MTPERAVRAAAARLGRLARATSWIRGCVGGAAEAMGDGVAMATALGAWLGATAALLALCSLSRQGARPPWPWALAPPLLPLLLLLLLLMGWVVVVWLVGLECAGMWFGVGCFFLTYS